MTERGSDRQPGGRRAAPGRLALLQAFLNTRFDLADTAHGETFTDPGALGGWLASRGLAPGSRRVSGDELARAITIREGLRALAFANNGRAPDPVAIARLNDAAAGAAAEVRLRPEGPEFVTGEGSGLDEALGVLLAIAAGAMIDGSWRRVKACPGRHCGWIFFDQSRNASSRWCSMKVCGAREKSRAFYRRRIGTGGASPHD
jgi:predicted RNA-binding Zn ribbon-like protein